VTRELWLVDHAPIMGGAEQLVLKIAAHARARGDVRAVVVCPAHSELARRSRAAGVELRTLAMPHFAGPAAPLVPLAVARLARLLRGAGPDAVPVGASAWCQALLAACAPLLPGRPILHLLAEQLTAERASARAVLARVGLPVALGANAAATYVRALGRGDVARFNNVLSDAELAAAALAPRRRRGGAAAREGGPPAIGVLARFIADKGLVELVDELAAAPRAWSVARLAGDAQDGAYVDAVRARIAARGLEGRVELVGRVEDVGAFLDDVDAIVVPSTGSEGQPTVILEALARGCGAVVRRPIFSADYAGLPVVAYDGEQDLGAALAGLPDEPAAPAALKARFGGDQALAALLAAAEAAGALRRVRR